MAQISDDQFKENHVREGLRPHTYSSRLGGISSRIGEALRIRDIPKSQLAALAVLSAVAIVCGVFLLRGGMAGQMFIQTSGKGSQPAEETVYAGSQDVVYGDEEICVYVAGEILVPGVYSLPSSSRVGDAIQAAGGTTEAADLYTLNLAQRLTDGQKVYVPRLGEQALATGNAAEGSGLVNLNTASTEALQTLPGIGPVTAQAIVDDREANGPYSSVDDVVRVAGVGEKTLAKFSSKACV